VIPARAPLRISRCFAACARRASKGQPYSLRLRRKRRAESDRAIARRDSIADHDRVGASAGGQPHVGRELMAVPPRHFRQRYLAPGARVRLIAPAGPFHCADFERGVELLRCRYEVDYEPEIVSRQGYLAGSDQRRLTELQSALDDPRCDGIVAARGGYGVTRLLDRLDPGALAARAPLLVGFSDITALHAVWARAQLGSVHGAMVAALGRDNEMMFARWQDAVEGRFPARYDGLECLQPGAAEGVLLGGNLAVLCALLGTPHFPSLDQAVLFLEDIGERPYRVDRMLTSLHSAGALAGVRAVVLGAFVESDPGPDGVPVEQVLRERLGELGIPVAAGLPCGHLEDNAELPLGRWVQLDAQRGTLYLDGWRGA
jgi:muramoyltetrapeptide carboxypeptidase